MLRERNDMEEIEMRLLGMVHCENSTCRTEPILKWDLIKESVKIGISERRAREALRYLERKGYFDPQLLSIDEYILSEKGEIYLEQLVSDFLKMQESEKQTL
jgi:hypothetical protein